MEFPVQAAFAGSIFQVNVGDYFLLDVIEETSDRSKRRRLLEDRIISLVSTLEKCVEIKKQEATKFAELIRDEVFVKYSPNGMTMVLPPLQNTNFKAVLQFSPYNWDRYNEVYCEIRNMCKMYSTDQISIELQPTSY